MSSKAAHKDTPKEICSSVRGRSPMRFASNIISAPAISGMFCTCRRDPKPSYVNRRCTPNHTQSLLRLGVIGVSGRIRCLRSPLLPVGLPTLVNQIGVDVFDVFLAQNVGEALHAAW